MEDVPAIEAKGLTKCYGNFFAISDIDLTVRRGEYMGLLGPNGSGKSTTLKAITGLLTPTSGTVAINGVDIKNHRTAMARVGCVIETPEPYPGFTPMEILDYVGGIYGLDKREKWIRSRDVLETVKMWEWRNEPVGGFSKGMRQRVVIAQALLANPNTIILDEPTSGLDPRGMIEVRQALAALKNKERSLLISTHMLKEVSEICGAVTMIRDGKVIASGDVIDLLRQEAANNISLEVRTVRPITSELVSDAGRCQGVTETDLISDRVLRLKFSGTVEDQEALTNMMFKSGLGILSMNEKGTDLESLYMQLTDSGDVK